MHSQRTKYTISYRTDKKELRKSASVICGHIDNGRWRFFDGLFSALISIGFTCVGLGLVWLLLMIAGISLQSVFVPWLVAGVAIDFLLLFLFSKLKSRSFALTYDLVSRMNLEMTLSNMGVTLRGEALNSQMSRGGVDAVLRGKGMTTLLHGASGYALSDRMFREAGIDPDRVFADLTSGHAESR